MKKLLLLGVLGVFFSSTFASNPTIEKEVEVQPAAADFPVYCDGKYAGDADTIEEALDMCGL